MTKQNETPSSPATLHFAIPPTPFLAQPKPTPAKYWPTRCIYYANKTASILHKNTGLRLVTLHRGESAVDIATIIGIVLAFATLLGTTGGEVMMFISIHAVIVVFGGLLAATFIKFNLKDIFNTVGILGHIFIQPKDHPLEIINQLVDMSNIARKDGILALEKVRPENQFLQTAINHSVDGMDPETLRDILEKDIEYLESRHKVGILMFDSMGEAAPAMGMVGTLFGMVEMLANMSDPSSIGPAMAKALLATTYGAVWANLFAIPFAIKLHHYSKEEVIIRQLVMDGIIGIQKGVNPRILEQMLLSALSNKDRVSVA